MSKKDDWFLPKAIVACLVVCVAWSWLTGSILHWFFVVLGIVMVLAAVKAINKGG